MPEISTAPCTFISRYGSVSPFNSAIIFVKDTTNQCIVDYIRYMIKFATTQRSYRYNNHIEDEEAYIIKEYKDSLTVEQ